MFGFGKKKRKKYGGYEGTSYGTSTSSDAFDPVMFAAMCDDSSSYDSGSDCGCDSGGDCGCDSCDCGGDCGD